MDGDKLRQLRGGVELAADAVESAVSAIARVHHAIGRKVYAPFALFGPLAAPAHAVEQLQTAITGQVYQTIATASRALAYGAVALLAASGGDSHGADTPS